MTDVHAALRYHLAPVSSNALALLITAVATTEMNRRLTFGIRRRAGRARDHAGGLLAFGLALGITTLALGTLARVAPRAGRWIELTVIIAANVVAAFVFVRLRQLSLRSIEWIVFGMGLLDGTLMAALTFITNGFDSVLYWVFPALILHNALAIPIATPQIALNVIVSCCYIFGGLGDKGVSPGDRFIWSGELFDRKGGKKVGRTGGDCENTGTAPHNDSLCTASFMLAGGQIITQGLSDTAALFGGKIIPWAAITGGTGIYRNAHGSSTVAVPVDVPNQTDADFVLYLR